MRQDYRLSVQMLGEEYWKSTVDHLRTEPRLSCCKFPKIILHESDVSLLCSAAVSVRWSGSSKPRVDPICFVMGWCKTRREQGFEALIQLII